MVHFFQFLSAMGKPAGSFIAAKIMMLSGKRALKSRWKSIIDEARKDPGTPGKDMENLKVLLEKPILEKLYPPTEDLLGCILSEAGLSESTAARIVDEIQLYHVQLAKNNAAFFYDFLVDAENKQLDGMKEIKKALGIEKNLSNAGARQENIENATAYLDSVAARLIHEMKKNHREIKSDTEAILDIQKDTVDLLGDIRERLLVLEYSTRSRPEGGTFTSGGGDHHTEIFDDLRKQLSATVRDLEDRDYGSASNGLFRTASVFFDLYKIYGEKEYYDTGNRCFSMGRIFRERA